MTRKKILFVITKSNFGGAQRYVFELATGLPKDQFEVSVAFGGDGLLKEKLEQAGIKTYQIKSFERDISIKKEFQSMFELARIIKEIRPDVIHLNSSKAGGTGAFVARILGVPKIIFTAHGWAFLEERSFLWRSIVWFLSYVTVVLVHKVILVSENDLRRTRMPFVMRKCSVIHTAIPQINFLPRTEARYMLFSHDEQILHSHDLWLVTIAELTQNKNIKTALEAVKAHNAENDIKIFYIVIGEGELRDELQAFIKDAHLETYVKLVGYVPEARNLLSAFDVFLLPSRKEGMPYAILEAGACGIPVIASNVGGIPEIIEDHVSGILINPKSASSITRALGELHNNEMLRHSLTYMLQKKVAEQFSLKNMLKETASLY